MIFVTIWYMGSFGWKKKAEFYGAVILFCFFWLGYGAVIQRLKLFEFVKI